MKKYLLLVILFLLAWSVISFILSTNELSRDGFLIFGFPLPVYIDFSGKSNEQLIDIGLNIKNLILTISLIILLASVTFYIGKVKIKK